MDSERLVERDLVDVLAHQHRRAQQPVRKRRHDDVPADGADGGVVGAAHHQRAPHDEDVGLTEPALLQPQRRCGVGDAEHESREREGQHRPAASQREYHEDREVGDVDQKDRHQQRLAAHQSGQHGVRRVQGARIVGAVRADLRVEQVVHQIVGDMGEGDSDQRQHQPAPVQARLPDRQQRGHQPGYQGHRQYRGPGHHEPARDDVDRGVRRRIRGAQGVRPGRNLGAGLDLGHSRIVCPTGASDGATVRFASSAGRRVAKCSDQDVTSGCCLISFRR